MKASDIEFIFKEYLKTINTQYAILINGSWGSGKTFFWKLNLTQIAEANNYKTIYISLNGLSKIEHLENQLFIKLLPIIGNQDNKIVKATTNLVRNAMNIASKTFFKGSLNEIFKDISVDTFNFSKFVICFDDLERSQIPVKEIFGFINNYVEHKSLKTIILADENNIDTTQKGYDTIKEKVIGRILNFELDIETVLPKLFERYKTTNNGFFIFLTKWSKLIIDISIEFNQDNLRVLSFNLEILEKISIYLKDKDEKYITEVIIFSFIISIEFKKGELKSSDSNDYKNLENIEQYYFSLEVSKSLTSKKDNENEKKSYGEKIYETYLTKRIREFFFYPSIYKYILTGYFNHNNFITEIDKRKPEIIPEEVIAYRTLITYKFRELPNDIFLKMVDKVYRYAQQGKYFIYDYPSCAAFFFFFSKNELISQTKDEIKSCIETGLNISGKNKIINNYQMENMLHFKDENDDVEEVKQKVKKIHDEIQKEKSKKEYDKFYEIILKEDEIVLSEFITKHAFSIELFKYIDVKILFDTIIKTSNKQLFNFTELLVDRYKASNIGEFLFEDYTLLSKLVEYIDDFTKTNKIDQPKLFLLKSLANCIHDICLHLAATKKP